MERNHLKVKIEIYPFSSPDFFGSLRRLLVFPFLKEHTSSYSSSSSSTALNDSSLSPSLLMGGAIEGLAPERAEGEPTVRSPGLSLSSMGASSGPTEKHEAKVLDQIAEVVGCSVVCRDELEGTSVDEEGNPEALTGGWK